MKLTTSFVGVVLATLSFASFTIVTAAPTANDGELGPISTTSDSVTIPPTGFLRRRQGFYQRRDFDVADFLARQEAVRAKQDAVAAAAASADSQSTPAPQGIAADPVPEPSPAAQTA
ncbi:hypothetical protein EC991_005484 [Linnemannia zychae]|nr:hypothetical protein EC991_005484 [Linnemannia zychae]